MMHGMTRRCPICGAPYKVAMYTVADQSACPECVGEAELRIMTPTGGERERAAERRARHFNGGWR